MRAGDHVEHEPLVRARQGPPAQRGNQPGFHQRRLAAATGADDGQKAVVRPRLGQPRQQLLGQRLAAEKQCRVRLAKGQQAFVRVGHIQQRRGRFAHSRPGGNGGAEGRGESAHVGKAIGRPLGQRPRQDAIDRRGHVQPLFTQRRHRLVSVLLQQFQQRPGGERRPAAQRLVGHQPQAVLVAEGRHVLVQRLFGRDVLRRAGEHLPGERRGSLRSQQPGNAEVGQVGVAVLVQQDVGRFHVAVDDAVAVGDGQRGGHLIQQTGHALRWPGRAVQRRPEVAAAQVAHDQVGTARLAPVVVEGDDLRVFQPGNGLGFGLEAADEGDVVGVAGGDDLDRHVAADGRLRGAEDNAVAAPAQLLVNVVATDVVGAAGGGQ